MTTVLATASLGIDEPAKDVPNVPGFIASQFNPLVYAVGRACLTRAAVPGEHLAIVLGTLMGDLTTTDLHSQRLIAGQVHNPLLFMQGTANSVLGFLGVEFGVTGPTLSISAWGDPVAPLLDMAELLLADGLRHVLVIGVELAAGARTDAAWQELTRMQPTTPALPARDLAAALLLGADGPPLPAVSPDGGVRDLLRIAEAARHLPHQPQGAR